MLIDFSHKNERFQKFVSEARQTFPNTLLDSEPDLDDLSETFLHDLENKSSDFQSVDPTSANFSSHFTSISSDEKTSQSLCPCSRIPSLKNIVLHCLLLEISFMVLFQVITDPQSFYSPCIDIANRIHFSLPQLSRNADVDTINSHRLVNISSWQHAIYH